MATIPPELADLSMADFHKAVQKSVALGQMTIVDLFDRLRWFRGGADWTAWRAFLCALYALPMTDAELAIYRECTARETPPKEPATEAWLICGRRARKSAIASLIGLWHGAFVDVTDHLAPGEVAKIPIMAKDKFEAKQIRSYIGAILSDPTLAYLLDGEPTTEIVPLITGVEILIRAATITAGRSYAAPAALLDEVAFFRSDESAHPDREILRGLDPSMANIPGALRLGLSSPYAPRGVLYEAHRDHFGKDGDPVLVWQASTLRMHDTPAIRATVSKAYVDDPIAAAAEYGAKFRSDIVTYVDDAMLALVVVPGRFELEPKEGVTYYGFVDPSGGIVDGFALGISHFERGRSVLDFLKEWGPEDGRPFSTEAATSEASAVLKRYRQRIVYGDHYAGNWPLERFRANGIEFLHWEQNKSAVYKDFLPDLSSRRTELLDNQKLCDQLTGLDRKVGRGGNDSIDHAPGGHDDLANAAAGALVAARKFGGEASRRVQEEAQRRAAKEGPPPRTVQEWQRQQRAAILERERRKPQRTVAWKVGR